MEHTARAISDAADGTLRVTRCPLKCVFIMTNMTNDCNSHKSSLSCIYFCVYIDNIYLLKVEFCIPYIKCICYLNAR